MGIKERVPWPAKMATKLVISRLPVPHAVWSRIGIFQHGSMQNVEVARRIWHDHFDTAWSGDPPSAFSCIELGPGDSLFTAVLARLAGASRTYLVDVGPFASTDIDMYRREAIKLAGSPGSPIDPARWESTQDLLADCNAEYWIGGLQSLKRVPTESIDFVFSNAVLEHVRKDDFLPILVELRRVLKPGGRCSHEIDLKDHLAKSLNSLRFPESIWESRWFASSGFYTNRLRCSEILKMAAQAGFDTRIERSVTWSTVPVPRSRLDKLFRHLDEDDLKVASFKVLMTPTASQDHRAAATQA